MTTAAALLVALSGLGSATAGAHLAAAQSGGSGPGVIVNDGVIAEVSDMEVEVFLADEPIEVTLADAPISVELDDTPIIIEVSE